MEVDYARAKLRKGKDEDIKFAFSRVPNHYDQSYIVREALRQFFFTCEGRVPLFTPDELFNKERVVMPQHRSHRGAELKPNMEIVQLERIDEDEVDLDKAIDSILN